MADLGSRQRVVDLPTATVRLPLHVRGALERAAFINKRSLGSEMAIRLAASVRAESEQESGANAQSTAEPAPAWGTDRGAELTETQRHFLRLFSSLSSEKQMALLALLA